MIGEVASSNLARRVRIEPSTTGCGDWSVASAWLDPLQPYLADHRPGGFPLLGTVGALEIATRCVASGEKGFAVDAIETIEAIKPVGVRSGPVSAIVRWRQVEPDAPGRRIVVQVSTLDDGDETLHLRAVLIADDRRPSPLVESEISTRLAGETIHGDEVYRVFFHGPVFQVVRHAKLDGACMVAALNAPLPRWSQGAESQTLVAPRLIEFGLQTAGLLQLALDGSMMIPRRIARIERFRATDVDHPAPLYAMAERAGSNPDDPIDIRILDDNGDVHLAVTGYSCVALPFAVDDGRLADLGRRLRATQA